MAIFVLCRVALASTLQVDAKLPTEVLVDGNKVAEVWKPARVIVDVPAGEHVVRIYRQGKPTDLSLTFPPEGTVDLVVGRTGITTNVPKATPSDDGPAVEVAVELRALSSTQIRLGRDKMVLGDGEEQVLEMPVGTYPISIRSPDGTVIWAKGQLVVQPGARLVVQIASGRLPEVSGAGRFDPS